eukprot:g14271.t1
MWYIVSAVPNVAFSTSGKPSGGLETTLWSTYSVHDKRQHIPVANHFNSPSHSLDDMSILGLLQCHNNATQRLEKQPLIFRLGTLQPNGINVYFTSFK